KVLGPIFTAEGEAADRDFHRRWRAKAHDLVHDVCRLEGKSQTAHALRHLAFRQSFSAEFSAKPIAQALRQDFAQATFQLFDADPAALLESDAQDCFLRPARPQVDVVNGISRWQQPNVAQRYGHIFRSYFFANGRERLLG